MNIQIRKLNSDEIASALKLTLEVFMEFEAPDYSQEGVEEFERFLNNQPEIDKLHFFSALYQDSLSGIIAMRNDHICLLFVKKEFHRKGIAKALFRHILEQTQSEKITVNSSPYAIEVYKRLGFTATNTEQVTNGIQYTPMVFTANPKNKG